MAGVVGAGERLLNARVAGIHHGERRKVELANGAVREIVDLDGFVLVPASDALGEPVDAALRDGEEFVAAPGPTLIVVEEHDVIGAGR